MPNILIVEDDPAVRDIVQIALEREGLSVEAVADGEAALKRFRSAGAFDLVLLDIMLPGIDGISLCQELRKSSDVPVVMLTARDGERSVVLGLEVAVLAKVLLGRGLHRVLEGRDQHTPLDALVLGHLVENEVEVDVGVGLSRHGLLLKGSTGALARRGTLYVDV